ncbi:hypothetical protein [Helicobacter heilmannii]|uniref:hypothetical protein n=1 Tax=Helicobacter heilmannii TaxID=35817 RepID=UPI0006A1E004|nr:hypothetical protein [Helicobacter heilmannii]GMB95079.1 hypothetical protein NHP21011_11770 [Helicobacter heilmannii]CRF47660.1 hypothetical protein HHE02_09540 [Helicobacter heilmannii]CRF50369.1 hypothetical protein HHE06_01940 [Helicobacter heilmannii]
MATSGTTFIPKAENLISTFPHSMQKVRQSHFGLDLGVAYRIKGFMVGLMSKYLNTLIRYAHLPSMRIICLRHGF